MQAQIESQHSEFSFTFPTGLTQEWLLRQSQMSAALRYVRGEYGISGNIAAAMRFFNSARYRSATLWTRAQFHAARVTARVAGARSQIRAHYDCSNEFYRLFLDPEMVYSCAYFAEGVTDLTGAQAAKLGHICRKLHLQAGERFLDIGCGWGALVRHAASRFGATAVGCTLSAEQLKHAQAMKERHPQGAAMTYLGSDYRELWGEFDKVASVGMFEHVGRNALEQYLRKVFHLVRPGGMFLNHGLVKRQGSPIGVESVFLQRRVFPGYELVHLSEVVDAAEAVGFEVLDVENLRPHYARTIGEWIKNMQRNEAECLKVVDRETYRTWLLYLAGTMIAFEDGDIDIHQTLLWKPGGSGGRPLTREYMYRTT